MEQHRKQKILHIIFCILIQRIKESEIGLPMTFSSSLLLFSFWSASSYHRSWSSLLQRYRFTEVTFHKYKFHLLVFMPLFLFLSVQLNLAVMPAAGLTGLTQRRGKDEPAFVSRQLHTIIS